MPTSCKTRFDMKFTSREYIVLLAIHAKDSGTGVHGSALEHLCRPFTLLFEERYEILDRFVNAGFITLENECYKLSARINEHLKQVDIYSVTQIELNRKTYVTLNYLYAKGGYQEGIDSRLPENIQRLILLLRNLDSMINEGDDFVQSNIDPHSFKNEIHEVIMDLAFKNFNSISSFSINFAPTGSLQDHSIANGWEQKFLEMADEFDTLINGIYP